MSIDSRLTTTCTVSLVHFFPDKLVDWCLSGASVLDVEIPLFSFCCKIVENIKMVRSHLIHKCLRPVIIESFYCVWRQQHHIAYYRNDSSSSCWLTNMETDATGNYTITFMVLLLCCGKLHCRLQIDLETMRDLTPDCEVTDFTSNQWYKHLMRFHLVCSPI